MHLPLLLPAVLPPVLVGGLGTTQVLRGHGLWFDELYTVAVVDRPLGDVVGLVADGRGPTAWLTDPPAFNGPYYAVAWLWSRLPLVDLRSDGLDGLRGLSLLASVFAVAVLVRAVERLHGQAVALVAGLLAAAAPLMVVQSVQARPYGLALLATALALLGAVRVVQGGGVGLLAVAGGAAGLLHWFALPAVGGLALGTALVVRRKAPVLAVSVAALPVLGLVALALSHGASGGGYLTTTGLLVPVSALVAWTGGVLALPVVVAVALGARAAGPLAWAWIGVPVVLVTAVDLVRPVFVPRYLLPTLLGLAVVAALGAVGRRWLLVLLVVAGVVADVRALTRPRWERADQVAAFLLAEQRPGEPVVAVEGRSAAGLAVYAAPTRLGADLRYPPDDPPAGATRVWLVRQLARDGATVASDDDDLLRTDGLRLVRTELFRATKTDLAVQLWTR
ncbi:MAG: glycosyltransferase family 39 protein [Mycobacteriales bacterium]|nr:glycosyltransferase family 39 protein [Mycobacteriales bacterium]